jgi:FkbM family methyltransferase
MFAIVFKKIKYYMRNILRRFYPKKKKTSLDPGTMWGKVFDLSTKQLVPLNGFSLFVQPDDYIGASIIKYSGHEPHVEKAIRDNLKEGQVFLDLGVNVGYFSMLASSIVGKSGKVIGFEPNPQNLQLIYESKLHNDFPQLKVYPFAVSDKEDILRFTTVGSNGGVVTPTARDQKHYLLVPSVILDEVLVYEPKIDMIKIDIEAHEPAALRGMLQLIKKHSPIFITEFHPWAMGLNNVEPPEDYLKRIAELDYEMYVILSTGELTKMAFPDDVMKYWQSLNQETIHLDLYCKPRFQLSKAKG